MHNQRIERLWVDVFSAVLQLYYRLFYHLENVGILDRLQPFHICALHYIFVPRIQYALHSFAHGWNHHSVSRCRGQSPLYLYTSGMLQLKASNLPALDRLMIVMEKRSVTWIMLGLMYAKLTSLTYQMN